LKEYVRFFSRILAYFRRDLRLITSLVILIGVSLAAGVLLVWPASILVDVVFSPRPKTDRLYTAFLSLLPSSTLGRVVGLALLGLVLKFTQDVTLLCRMMINNRLKYSGTARVRRQLFDHLLRQTLAFHRSRPQGDTIYRVTTDAWGFFGVLDTFIGAAVSAVTLLVMTAVMLSRSIPMTAVALSIAPALVLVNWYFGRTIRTTTGGFKRTEAGVMTVVQRAVAGVALVQLFGRRNDEALRFGDSTSAAAESGMRMGWQVQLYPLAVQTVFGVGKAAVLACGGYLVWRDLQRGTANGFTIGEVLAFLVYIEQLWLPLSTLTGFHAAVQTHAASCERVFQVLDREPEVQDPTGPVAPLKVMPRTLELRDVSFAYPGDAPVLRGIDAAIRPGEMVAFIGPSGAGKSTLLGLVPRFFDPTAGAITLDGMDLRSLRLEDVRRHVTLVPQENALLPTTIGENIAYGRPGATRAQVREAARLAGAAEFVERMPEGYDTPVTEGAQNLSGGQRQRIAIARALLTEAPVLVLDEPTSALDPHHERVVMETLRRLKGTRTLILVTHRLESVADCDRVYVLERGSVARVTSARQVVTELGALAEADEDASAGAAA
jgi:subfamily B ATP-binding cassette protein MsbA